MANQRDTRRAPVATTVTLRVVIEGDPRFFTGLARDISTGGVFVNAFQVPQLGERLVVRLQIPGNTEPIELDAEVAWVRPDDSVSNPDLVGFGARFVDPPLPVTAAINRHIQACSSCDEFYA